MRGKVVLPVVILSLLGVIASTVVVVRDQTRTYRLVLTLGSSTGKY